MDSFLSSCMASTAGSTLVFSLLLPLPSSLAPRVHAVTIASLPSGTYHEVRHIYLYLLPP